MSGTQTDLVPDPIANSHNPEHYKIGTLTYTKASLVSLFLFLLWGDFCFTIMETVIPNLLPLQLNKLGAPNWTIGLIVTTIPNVMNIVMNPVISFRSDRFRSKWGRRIPFLAAVTPFLVLFLALLGYAEPISHFIEHYGIGGHSSDLRILLVITSVLLICYQFFNLFVASIYYYLFNDVVPRAFLARMMALFRVVGTCAGSFYNFFLFPHSEKHMPEIFLGAAVLYLVGFTMMCFGVKEGKYPPPPENIGSEHGLLPAMKTYAVECFSHRFYWFIFLANSCLSMTWVSGSFGNLLSLHVMGFDRAFVGEVSATMGIISMVLLYPAGILADRYHPLRVVLIGLGASLLLSPLSIIFPFVRDHMSLATAQYIHIGLSAITLPAGTLQSAAEAALFMRLFPQDRYGQFCSANALVRSLALIVGGMACGAFLDFMVRFGTNADACYRFVPVWNCFFQCGYMLFYYLVYREWKRAGGQTGFVPPGTKPTSERDASPGNQRVDQPAGAIL